MKYPAMKIHIGKIPTLQCLLPWQAENFTFFLIGDTASSGCFSVVLLVFRGVSEYPPKIHFYRLLGISFFTRGKGDERSSRWQGEGESSLVTVGGGDVDLVEMRMFHTSYILRVKEECDIKQVVLVRD